MASIIKKKSKYSTYYVVAESARVDGKPRIVKQWYLGTIEKIIALAEGNTDKEEPRQIDCVSEGAIAVLFNIAEELGIRKIIDQHCRKRQQGMSVGDYILIAALNRALAATSKSKIAEWVEKAALVSYGSENLCLIGKIVNESQHGIDSFVAICGKRRKINKISGTIGVGLL